MYVEREREGDVLAARVDDGRADRGHVQPDHRCHRELVHVVLLVRIHIYIYIFFLPPFKS